MIRRQYSVYNKKSLLMDLSYFVLMVVLMKATNGSGFALFLPLAFFAVFQNKAERLLVLMMVSVAAIVGNAIIMPKNTIFGVAQKMMIVSLAFVLTTRLSGIRHSRLLTPFLGILPYVAYMALSSMQGWNPMISFLKLFLFTACYFAYYSLANMVITDRRVSISGIRCAYLSLACFLLIGSVLLIPFPGISQMQMSAYMEAVKAGVNVTSLFCGMTVHSQSLGPLVGVFFVLLLTDTLFSIRKANPLVIMLLLCCPILIYKTSSRTAMGVMLAGGLFAFYLFMQARNMGSRWKSKVVSLGFMLAIVGSLLLLVSGSGRRAMAKYVLKGQDVSSLKGTTMSDVVSTRQALMDSAMANFKKSPMLGNGFQVSPAHIGVGGLRNILSAPIEKGVWVTAVLEEGGVFGFALFVAFGLFAIPILIKRKAYSAASILFTIYVLNLGEFTFFAMSGIGGFYWCLCFVGAAMDAQRLRMQKREKMMRVYGMMNVPMMGAMPPMYFPQGGM